MHNPGIFILRGHKWIIENVAPVMWTVYEKPPPQTLARFCLDLITLPLGNVLIGSCWISCGGDGGLWVAPLGGCGGLGAVLVARVVCTGYILRSLLNCKTATQICSALIKTEQASSILGQLWWAYSGYLLIPNVVAGIWSFTLRTQYYESNPTEQWWSWSRR